MNKFSLPVLDDILEETPVQPIPISKPSFPVLEKQNAIYAEDSEDEDDGDFTITEDSFDEEDVIQEDYSAPVHPYEKPINFYEDISDDEPVKKQSIFERIKSEIGGDKSQSEDQDNESDEDDLIDYDFDEPQKTKKKKGNLFVKFYNKIADTIFKFIMLLKHVPFVGKLFKLTAPFWKIISKLWLPILVVIIIIIFPNSKPQSSKILSDKDTKIEIISTDVNDTDLILTIQNIGDLNADFAIEARQGEIKCFSSMFILNTNDSEEFTLNCNKPINIKRNIEYVLSNYN